MDRLDEMPLYEDRMEQVECSPCHDCSCDGDCCDGQCDDQGCTADDDD